MNNLEKKEIIIDGKKVEIVISIPEEEIENNNDLFDLENTLELEVKIDE